MKRDLGIAFTVMVGMATFAIALVAGIFLIWETGASASAQGRPQSPTSQGYSRVTLDVQRGASPMRLRPGHESSPRAAC
jgi:hypothetical protein